MIQIIDTVHKVSHEPGVVRLIREMMDGRIEEIRPVMDINQESGVAYPQIEEILGAKPDECRKILESLAEEHILEPRFFDRLIFCPVCNSMNLRPSLRCLKCGSGNIVRGRIIEHFACGKNALEEEFVTGGKYVCPHCRKALKFLGTDYRSLGVNYKCRSCGLLFNEISLKWQCMKCSVFFADDEAKVQIVNSYVLDEQNRNRLNFDMSFKSDFVDFLKKQGYEVYEKAKVSSGTGSGAVHIMDILAQRDDGFLVFNIGVGIAIGNENEDIGLEDVFRYDNRAYDLGIHDKVLLALPGFNSEARQFARRQRIKSFDAKELEEFLKAAANTPARPVHIVPFQFQNKKQLLKYLSGQGYKVEENARIKGRSGAEYTMDIVAYFDDGIFTHTISIGILSTKEEVGMEAISSYDTKAYDIGIHDKIVIVSSPLSQDAKQFASQQRIQVIEAGSIAALA